MSFNLASKINNIEGDTSFLLGNLPDLATNTSVATNLAHYYTKTTSDATFALRDSPAFTGTATGITSAMVGLGNVNNTSDADKPVSTATQTAFTNLVNGAPVDMNTLEKLANAVANDPDFAVHVTALTDTKQGTLSVSAPFSSKQRFIY